jgi:hypothetical protein
MGLTKFVLLGCFISALPAVASAQQRAPEISIDTGYLQMYNLEFDAARRTFAAWKSQNPNDPVGPASMAAAYLFAEFDRLNILQSEFFVDDKNFRGEHNELRSLPEVRVAFDREIGEAQRIAARRLASNPRDTTALFATILTLGLRSDYAGLIEKRDIAALSDMKQSRQLSERLLSIDPQYYDAYLAGGVENYMLSQKALPMRWLLRLSGAETDKAEGIRRVKLTAGKGRYLKPFALLLVAVAALRDKDIATAKSILRDLSQQFPRNHLYSEELSRLR